MVIEVLPANAAKSCQMQFGVAPEGLNAVDMRTVSGKFILMMVDAKVLIALVIVAIAEGKLAET